MTSRINYNNPALMKHLTSLAETRILNLSTRKF